MRYLEPSIGLLCFLWITIGALLAGRGTRNWQLKAQALMGLSGMSFFGLVLYVRWSPRGNVFYTGRGLLGGIVLGIFVTLFLEGSWNPLKRYRKKE
jgi:hypothetical protein